MVAEITVDSWLEYARAQAAIGRTWWDAVDADTIRARLCTANDCTEHADGGAACPVPTEPDAIDLHADYVRDRREADPDLEHQSVAIEDVRCPDCGAEVSDDSITRHRLSNVGYLHDDVEVTCSVCEHSWPHGEPVGGDIDDPADSELYCSACRGSLMRVHRVTLCGPDTVGLHLKCPACHFFDTTERELDPDNVALVGYPDITGSTDGADPYGWTEHPPTR